MQKKSPYEEPRIEVTFFSSTDVVTVSPPRYITDEDGNITGWDKLG